MSTKLPLKGTKEAQIIIDRYLKSGIQGIRQLASELNYASSDNYVDAMRGVYGVYRSHQPRPEITETPPIIIPEINILKYEPKGRRTSPETQALVLGDWHMGEITPTFNPEVAGKRLDTLFQSTMRITELHRHIYPINDLVIFVVGDMTHGDNPTRGLRSGRLLRGQ